MAVDDPKTQIQTTTPAAPANVTSSVSAPAPAPVKAPKARMAPETFNKITERLDAVLVGLVLVFAFLSAAFSIRNSDFFQYIATGRLIAQGEYAFGNDPFTFVAEDVRWVNHSWLFSFFLYKIYNLGPAGATILIVLKALTIAGIAAILLDLSRKPGQRWLIPASCTAVAILALSTRVLLQPVVVSYLFLALTLLVLRWPSLRPAAKPVARRPVWCFWLLVPLFVLWVNCDQWFFLGPLVAGLYWLGEFLQDFLNVDRTPTRPPGELRTLGYAVLVSAAACLVNPHSVFALTLPPQLGLSASAPAVAQDEQLKLLFLSPLDKGYWTLSQGLSAAGIAYFPLLIAGIVSFGLSYKALSYWRLLLFTAFALLSLYHARAIAFFAIVAGPIASLNFLDFAAARLGDNIEPDSIRERWLFGRVGALIAAVALVVCSIPGWTQAQPYGYRHLGWTLVPDESLVRTCTKMAEWRRDGLLKSGETHWFNVGPDVVHYMAWYCPHERGFFDLRWGLYDYETAKAYTDVRSELLLEPSAPPKTLQPGETPKPAAWPDILKDREVDYLVIYYPDPQMLSASLLRLLEIREMSTQDQTRPPLWAPLSIDGHTLVFALNTPKKKNPDPGGLARNERLHFDLSQEAFGPQAKKAPGTAPPLAVKHEWYAALWEAPVARRQETDDAVLYSAYYGFQLQKMNQKIGIQQYIRRSASRAAVVGGVVALPAMLGERSPFASRLAPQMPVSAAPLYVALRELRQSLHANPDDPQAYLRLAQTYKVLFWESGEFDQSLNAMPSLIQIRQAQFAWAANKALELNPDLMEGHRLLADWYAQCRMRLVPCYADGNIERTISTKQSGLFLDRELKHRQEQIRLIRQRLGAAAMTEEGDALPEAPATALEANLKKMEQQYQLPQLAERVKQNLDAYELQSNTLPAYRRAEKALELGLADKALEVLRSASHEEMMVTQNQRSLPLGYLMEMNLLVALGETDGLDKMMDDYQDTWRQFPVFFGGTAYDWFRLLLAAGAGDYDEADKALGSLTETANKDYGTRINVLHLNNLTLPVGPKAPKITTRETVALVLGKILLVEAANMGQPWHWTPESLTPVPMHVQNLENVTLALLNQEAEWPALRGWLALEAGNLDAARKHYSTALNSARPRDRNLALSAVLGPAVAVPGARVQEGPLWTEIDLLPLRSRALASLGLYYLDSAQGKRH